MLTGIDVSTQQLVRLRPLAHSLYLSEFMGALLTGETRSAIPGRGMDYEESRKYTPGDDSRMIDWRVTARTGSAHTKVFREDRQRMVYLVVDMSSTMRFGTRTAFKSVVAAEAASLLAWAALDQGNLVSITGISDSRLYQSRFASVARSLTRQLAVLSDLSRNTETAAGFDGLSESLASIAKRVRYGDMVIALSDFSRLSASAIRSFEYFSSKRALSLIWISDAVERTALPAGNYRVTDGTSYAALRISSRRHSRKLQRILDERNERFREAATRARASLIQLTPGDDVSMSLQAGFSRRLHVRRLPASR
ncbi:MAG: DUF58 domain-containing protein [Acidiferrobacterales bacterium]|nr:DUF58 domain-containing protein [Acidiferrobacterales bacterium]